MHEYLGIEYVSSVSLSTQRQGLQRTYELLEAKPDVIQKCAILRYFDTLFDHRISFAAMYLVLETLGRQQVSVECPLDAATMKLARSLCFWKEPSDKQLSKNKAFQVLVNIVDQASKTGERPERAVQGYAPLKQVRNCLTHEYPRCRMFDGELKGVSAGATNWANVNCTKTGSSVCKDYLFQPWKAKQGGNVLLSAYVLGKLRALLQFLLLAEVGVESSFLGTYFRRFVDHPI